VAWAATRAGGVIEGETVVESTPWVAGLGLGFDFRLDAFALLMVGLVSGIGVLIFLYAAAYFSDKPQLNRFAASLVAFAGSMLGLVLADNVLLLFVFWELTSITSYLLIGFEDTKPEARAAALQAFLITGAGGLALLAGVILLGLSAGTYSFSEILAAAPDGPVVAAGLLCCLAAAFTKSAQVPFHSWLPGAMAAPTPVSAYLHSATMVKAGVYLIARLAPSFAEVGLWRPLVLTVGATTMVVGGYRALRQIDLKLVLAYGTISQLGFMVVLLGVGLPGATFAGAALLLAHGAFKATLFMVVGIVDHQAHSRDLRRLTGLAGRMRLTFVVALVATASMAGLPPLLGFISKEAAFEELLHLDIGPSRTVVLATIVVGSVLTFAYSARFLWGTFARKPAAALHDPVAPETVPLPATAFVLPAALLAAFSLAMGLFPTPVSPFVGEAGVALDPELEPHALYLWHGFNAALGLSVLTYVLGGALFLGRDRVEAMQARMPAWPTAQGGYQATVTFLTRTLADRVTAVVQNGSLPMYMAVILATVLVLPGATLATRASFPSNGLVLADHWLQLVVAVVVVTGAAAAVLSRRRFAAVLFLGGVGYGVGVLFLIQGAPDLALTQFLVETLAIVIFVLVLRHLPERFEARTWHIGQGKRILLAGGVGVFVASFALVAAAARPTGPDAPPPVSDTHIEQAYPEAHGRNVVNVILVDFRGFDTMGEIVVLTVAALGIVGLVRAARRERDPSDVGPSARAESVGGAP
jgi:multicomponent Na+:H+ antiporter subunit A